MVHTWSQGFDLVEDLWTNRDVMGLLVFGFSLDLGVIANIAGK